MKVWRVQNSEGIGPYYSIGNSVDWADEVHSIYNGRPTPDHETRLCGWENRVPNSGRWKFGFNSMEQLQRWFKPREIENLRARGFEIVCLEAEQVLEGDFQVIFLEAQNGQAMSGCEGMGRAYQTTLFRIL